MYYIAYYTTPDDVRISSPAACEKIKAISHAISKGGMRIEVVSSCLAAKQEGWIAARSVEIFPGVVCRQFSLWSTKHRFFRSIQSRLLNAKVFFFLLTHTHKNDQVLFYHAIERTNVVLLAKRIRKFRLILEVEEVYSDILNLSEEEKNIEKKAFQYADAFVFSTGRLSDEVNTKGKPFVVINGNYISEPVRNVSFHDSKKHCVYAGTFEEAKGGAMTAISLAEFLPDDYHIHILGFGNSQETEKVQNLIEEKNKVGSCTITYDGLLRGEAFVEFLQKCQIGLCTQIPDSKYVNTSFPSKILVYMANGLRVVSADIPAVRESVVGEHLYFYQKQEAKEIAQVILGIDTSGWYDSRLILEKARTQFEKEIMKLLIESGN